ncbi:MAG: hypothetical protein R2821_00580 [Flavobacteriaceae bacterium]
MLILSEYIKINDINFEVVGMYKVSSVRMGATKYTYTFLLHFNKYIIGDSIGWFIGD